MSARKSVQPGELVAVYLTDQGQIEYFGGIRREGKVLRRLGDGRLRVELFDTGSQDSEGHNAWVDVHPKSCYRIRRPREWVGQWRALTVVEGTVARVWVAFVPDSGAPMPDGSEAILREVHRAKGGAA